MKDHEILDSGPEGWTHCLEWQGRITYFTKDNDGEVLFQNAGDYEWHPMTYPIDEFTRSRADIERIVELENMIYNGNWD